MNVKIIAFIAIFFGVVLRTFLPFLRKWLLDPEMEWSQKFLGTAAFTIIVSFVATILGYQGFTPPDAELFDVIIQGVMFGLGLSSLVNEIVEWPEDLHAVRRMVLKAANMKEE